MPCPGPPGLAVRSALRSVGMQGACGAARSSVVCSSGGGGGGGNGKSRAPLTPDQQRRALSVLSNTRQLLDWKQWGSSLGGTLIVDDASHKEDVQRAMKEGTLSFGFSAGGCLFPYYIGTAGALMDAGILTDRVKVGGASAGSLLAACIKSGMALDNVVEQNLRLMEDLRRGGTRGRLGPVVRTFLEQSLPEDAHVKCRDSAYVAVTKVAPLAKPVLVSDFDSRDDLIQALMTSCHIPFWLDGNPFTVFRGERHCDGGLTNFIPIPPNTVGVRVCCFPSKQLSSVYRIGISPDSFEPWGYSLRQMVQWAFEPADEATVAALIDKGKEDAQAWMHSMDLVGEAAAVERAEQRDVGTVSAAKEAAVGTADAGVQQRAQEEGMQKLDAKAREGAGAGEGQLPAAQQAAGAKEEQARGGEAQRAQRSPVEAVAEKQDQGASREEQERAAEAALREAEEREGEGGNLWARALAAAGVAASAAAVAATVAGSAP